MEIFLSAVGRLGGNLLLVILAAVFDWIPAENLAFYAIGVILLTISTTIMQDGNEIVRTVLFYIAAALMIIPSFILNIQSIQAYERDCKMFRSIFFTINASVLAVSWFFTGAEDGVIDCTAETIATYYSVLVWAILKFIFQMTAHALSILFLVVGIIILILLVIFRIIRGSAFEY